MVGHHAISPTARSVAADSPRSLGFGAGADCIAPESVAGVTGSPVEGAFDVQAAKAKAKTTQHKQMVTGRGMVTKEPPRMKVATHSFWSGKSPGL